MRVRACLILFILVLALPIPAVAHALRQSETAAQSRPQSCTETLVAPSNVDKRDAAAFAGFLNSTPPASVPKREVMRRDPSDLAENVLTPLFSPFRDLSMRFNMLRAIGGSGIALTISTLIAGCGGGNTADGSTQDSVASSSTATSTSTASSNDAAIIQAGASTATSTSTASSNDTAIIQAGAASSATGSASDASSGSSSGSSSSSTDSTAVSVDALTARAGGVASAKSGVGTNLAQMSYFSAEYPTIDFMKRASGWLTQCSPYTNKDCKTSVWDSGEESQLDLDANGWIKSLPATGAAVTYRYATTIVLSGGTQPVGKYVILYDGQGTLAYSGVGTKVASESSPGRDVVNVTNGTGGLFVSITATTPANYMRNIRIYAPGGACDGDMTTWVTSATACTSGKGAYVAFENFPAGSTWFPTFMNGVKGFRTLRFMDWGQTNLTKVTSWAARTSPTYRTWSGNAGVPVEAMFDLAKSASTDPWMNIPPYVDDDYIHQFGKLAHQKLAAGETLNLEYGNEMWNYAFPATIWSVAQAKVAFASSLAKGVDQNSLMRNWYAQRLVQACNIVKAEFGADASRVRCIANTMAASAWDTSQVLSCPYAGGACAKSIDAVAIAPYFGQYISNTANRPTVTTWYADADGGLTKMFQEIDGNDVPGAASAITPLASTAKAPGGALAGIKAMMIATKAAAGKYGIPMWAYEGGQGLLAAPGDTDQNLLNLMIAANRDPRMGVAYQTMMQDWVAAGGQTFAFFTDIAPATKWGFWGLRESQFDTTANAPKWKAAVQWRDNTACWWTGC